MITLTRSLKTYSQLSGETLNRGAVPRLGPRFPPKQEVNVGGELRLEPGTILDRLALIDGYWVGAHHWMRERCDRVLIRDCTFQNHEYWASRSYRMSSNNVIENCAFLNVAREHAVYWNMAQGQRVDEPALVIRNTVFENIASQAIQLVQREEEQGIDLRSDMGPMGDVILSGIFASNVGWGQDGNRHRPGYAISIFGRDHRDETGKLLGWNSAEQNVRIRGIMIDNSMQEQSHGAIYIGPRPGLTLSHARVMMGPVDRAPVKLQGVENAVISDGFFAAKGEQLWIDLVDCGEVTFRNCRGGFAVHRNGTDVGRLEGQEELKV